MRLPNIRKRVGITVALATMLATGVIWEVRRARAANPPDPDRFGMVGLTRGQTMRLNVVNLANPPDPDRGACRPTMEVFDNSTGRTSLFSAGFTNPPEPDRQQ